jgi:hypothetical protein
MKTPRYNSQKAQKHLKKIYQLMSQKKSPFENMSEEEVISHLRKTREKLWEEKLAPRS